MDDMNDGGSVNKNEIDDGLDGEAEDSNYEEEEDGEEEEEEEEEESSYTTEQENETLLEQEKRLYYSSYEAYVAFHNSLDELRKLPESKTVYVNSKQEEVLKLTCGRYTSLLKSFHEEQMNLDSDYYIENGKKTFYDLVFMNLFEIIYLRKSEKLVNYLLVLWNQKYIQPITEISKGKYYELTESPVSFNSQNLTSWEFLLKFALEGRLKEVITILKNYVSSESQNMSISNSRRKMFQLLDTVFSKGFVPVCPPHFNKLNFKENFKIWQNYFTEILRLQGTISKTDRFCEPLLDLLKIFCGDIETLIKYSIKFGGGWISYFISLLLFKFPSTPKTDLFRVGLRSFEEFGKYSKNTEYEEFHKIVLSTMDIQEDRIEENLKTCEKFCSNFFLCHCSDLLYHRKFVLKGTRPSNSQFGVSNKKSSKFNKNQMNINNNSNNRFSYNNNKKIFKEIVEDEDGSSEGSSSEYEDEEFIDLYLGNFLYELIQNHGIQELGLRYLYYYRCPKGIIVKEFFDNFSFFDNYASHISNSKERGFYELVSIMKESLKHENPNFQKKVVCELHRRYGLDGFKVSKNYVFAIHHLFEASAFRQVEEIAIDLLSKYHSYLIQKIDLSEDEDTPENNNSNYNNSEIIEHETVDLIRMVGVYLSNSKPEFLEIKVLYFLKLYSDLLELITEEKSYHKASLRLVEIFKFKLMKKIVVPECLIYQLLKHAICLVDKESDVFSYQDVEMMLKLLTDVCVSHDSKTRLRGVKNSEIDKIRMSLLHMYSEKVCDL